MYMQGFQVLHGNVNKTAWPNLSSRKKEKNFRNYPKQLKTQAPI